MIRPLPVRDCHRGGKPNPCQRRISCQIVRVLVGWRFGRNGMEKESAVGSGSTVE